MSLIHPDFADELDFPEAERTAGFVGKALKGLHYAEFVVVGTSITGQVKNGDGENVAVVTDVIVRTVASIPVAIPPDPPPPATDGLVSVTQGTAVQGAGTTTCWLRTLATGVFAVSVSGTPPILVEVVIDRGVSLLVPLP